MDVINLVLTLGVGSGMFYALLFLFSKLNPNEAEEISRHSEKWANELRKYGENPSSLELLKLALNRRRFSEDEIFLEAFWTEEEYKSLLNKFGKTKIKEELLFYGYKMAMPIRNLHSAVLAKRLSSSIDNLDEGIDILKAKQMLRSLTETEKERLSSFIQLRKEYSLELNKIVYLPSDDGEIPEITFLPSDFIGNPKYYIRDEMLRAVQFDEDFTKINIVDEHDVEDVEKEEEKYESLPLADMKKFLSKNDLPDDVSKKIQETIHDIEEQIQKSKTKEKEEQIRMEAETLIKTAKEYHQMKK